MQADKTEKLFCAIKKDFDEWVKDKPTARIIVEIEVNQGGVRGKHKISQLKKI